jgi:hypothetical protein
MLQLDNKDKETGANISKFIRLLIKRELDQLENQLLLKALKTYEDKSTCLNLIGQLLIDRQKKIALKGNL